MPNDTQAGHVVVYDRHGPRASERRYDIGDEPERLRAFGAALAGTAATDDAAIGDASRLAEFGSPTAVPARPAVLVCTQGSHDVCCGSEGTRLADELHALIAADAESLPQDLQVFRVSHTGGHRFAPTALTLPDGRMWARLDAAMVGTILKAEGDPAALAGHCRGWWGAETGSAQMAERALFAEIGWSLNAMDRTVAVEERDSAQSDLCAVTTEDGRWTVEVAVGREVPTIACRQPGGLPAKPGREYKVLLGPR